MGLGLTVSRQLARATGGDLTYRYESERSIFELSLRRAQTPPVAAEEPLLSATAT